MGNASFFRSQVGVFIDKNLSPQAQSAHLAAYAKTAIGEMVAEGRFPAKFKTIVDGREGADETSVRPDGVIVYRGNLLPAAIGFALSFLIGRSPPKSSAPISPSTGKTAHYRDSFFLGINGRFVPAGQFRPELVPPDAEVIIGNSAPYARKVDVQFVGSKALRFSVPPGLFHDAAQALRREYGPVLDVQERRTINFPGQYVLRQGGGSKARRAGARVESPALIITAR